MTRWIYQGTIASSYCIAALCVCSAASFASPPDKSIMAELAPWVSQNDISLEPKLLTVDDLDSIKEQQDRPETFALPANETSGYNKIQKSALESFYSAKAGSFVPQFGYDQFSKEQESSLPHISKGAVQDSYLLGTGDEVSITLRGQTNVTVKTDVNSEGLILVDGLPPVMAAGRPLGDVRKEMQSLAAKQYNTELFLSLSAIKQINILIAGHIHRPGRHVLSSFDTLIDALIAAGGIEKTGSLRQIRFIRNGHSSYIDLYDLLIFGSDKADLTLRDGDKIIIRPIGPTLAITGGVKRPGIYELLPALQLDENPSAPKSERLALNDALQLSGGLLSSGHHRFLHIAQSENGGEQVEEISDPDAHVLEDGDILTIGENQKQRKGTVELVGSTREAGSHALSETPTLSDLLHDDSVLGEDIYPLIAVIERWNDKTLSPELISFSPRQILSGEDDKTLKSGDVVHLFSRSQILNLKAPKSDSSLPEDNQETEKESASSSRNAQLKSFLIEQSIFIRGAVRNPGVYPIAKGTNLESAVAVAGGLTTEANSHEVEISSPNGSSTGLPRRKLDLDSPTSHKTRLMVGDTIRVGQTFRRVEDNHVLLAGEVKNPGSFDLLPGDSLKTLIERAGGLSEQAYPAGAIFSRASERKREETRFKSQARDLEMKLAASLEETDADKKPDPKEIAIARELILEMKQTEAVGRITVEADPGVLASQPQLDILLEGGDRIFIPKRPLNVRVAGEILSPAALQFRTEKTPKDYIAEAGGFTYNADKDRAFVVYPNGSAQPLAVSSWNHNPAFVPPGSTIIVPRDPKPYSFMDGAKDLSQILASLATTAIFAEDLADDD